MVNKRKDEQATEMYRFYMQGKSLSEVGKMYGVTRQSVFKMFDSRNWEMRDRLSALLKSPNTGKHGSLESRIKKEKQIFDGFKYTESISGYYRKTCCNRSFMHRDVWAHYNGVISDGWDIHHKDENKANNDIRNLECLPKAEHTRLYSPHNNQYTKGRKRHESVKSM